MSKSENDIDSRLVTKTVKNVKAEKNTHIAKSKREKNKQYAYHVSILNSERKEKCKTRKRIRCKLFNASSDSYSKRSSTLPHFYANKRLTNPHNESEPVKVAMEYNDSKSLLCSHFVSHPIVVVTQFFTHRFFSRIHRQIFRS